MGIVQNALFQQQSGLADGEACGISLTGRVSASAKRGHIGILAGNHMHLIQADTYHIRCHLGIGSVSTLADLCLPQLYLQGTILIQYHTAGRGLQGDWPYCRVVPEYGHADTTADIAGLILVFLVFTLVIRCCHALVHTLVKGIAVQLILGKFILKANRHQVLSAECDRVHADLCRNIIGVAFNSPHSLRNTVSAHGSGSRLIGKYRIAICLNIVARVKLRECTDTLCADAVAVGCIRSLVGECLQLSCRKGSVRTNPGYDMAADRMAYTVGNEGFLPRHIQLNQMTAQVHADPCAKRLIQNVLLVAEAAADVRLDNLHTAPVNSQCLSHHASDNVRDLSGTEHTDALALHLCSTDKVLDMAVLHGRRAVPALYLDKARLPDGFLIITLADHGVL